MTKTTVDVIPLSLYKHYKRNHINQVLMFASHCDDLTTYVVYQDIQNPEKVWIRPKEQFCEKVISSTGEEVPRFRLLKDNEI